MPKDRNPDNMWLNEPTGYKSQPDVELWRVPKSGYVTAIVLSHELLGRPTHHFYGRTGPCTGDGCPACAAGRVPREYFWLFCMHRTTEQLFILEITDRAATPLARAWHQFRTLRGLLIEVGRTNKKANGPQRCKIISKIEDTPDLPKAPPLIPIMNRIWQIAADPWKNPSPDQIAAESRAKKETPTNGVNHQMGQQPTDGLQRTGRPRTADDLRIVTEEDRGLRQSPTARACEPDPSAATESLPHRRNGMANIVPPIEGPMGGGKQAS